MKHFLLIIVLSFLFAQFSNAQDFVQISTGSSYSNQAYYDIASLQTVATKANDQFDLVFTAFGQQDAGIHVNESTISTFGAPAPEVELYLTEATNLTEVTAFDSLFTRVYNDEESWAYGAVNNTRDEANIADYGWGAYNPISRQVVGSKVFVIKLRSGAFKKFTIDSLALTTYHMTYANLDGTEENSVAIDKNNFQSGLAYFSFETGNAIDLGVPAFDLVFTRYITDLYDSETGDTLDYPVTGILSGPGVEVAKIVGMAPEDVTLDNVPDEFSNRIDIIGWDWKAFSFTSGWSLADSTSYIVKARDNKLYKLVFIDFEGSSTGVATFEQTELGVVSTVNDANSIFKGVSVFPNPIINDLNLVFDLKKGTSSIDFQLFNQLGQQVWANQRNGIEGLNAIQFDLPNLSKGYYSLIMQTEGFLLSKKVIINQ